LIARAVKAFGFNTTLAPVVDLALPEAAEVLGSRPPGTNAADVTAFARAFLDGLAVQGIIGCGKHFPGLGGATGDTHFVTPEIERNWQQIWNEDLVPYRELHAAMPMIMMNHAAYPATPGKNRPASASEFWITAILRKRIGYRGIILSDDLEMGGILKFLPVQEAAIAAVRAGRS
jgi:beta-N-acetylhexosaminidase